MVPAGSDLVAFAELAERIIEHISWASRHDHDGVVHYLGVSPEDPERLYVALGHNRGDFCPDEPANRDLVDQHLLWCLDQRERGWLLPGRVPIDNLTLFATTSRAELARVLELDPLVAAGVRHYAITGCHAAEPAVDLFS